MAVIDVLPGVEVTVDVDGNPLKEYEDRDEEEPEKTITRYVEAQSGKKFSIRVKCSKECKFKGDSITFRFYADGTNADAIVLEKTSPDYVCQGFESHGRTSKFRFSTLETGKLEIFII